MSEPSGTDARLDRIEELMKEKTALNHLCNAIFNRHIKEITAAEAKLTKAVEALRSVDDEYSDTKWGPELTSIKEVRAMLGELEGM